MDDKRLFLQRKSLLPWVNMESFCDTNRRDTGGRCFTTQAPSCFSAPLRIPNLALWVKQTLNCRSCVHKPLSRGQGDCVMFILARVASASLTPSFLTGPYLSDQGAQSFLSIHNYSLINSSSLTLSTPSVHKRVPGWSSPLTSVFLQSHHCYLHLNISKFNVIQTSS